jgi:hypothetical protein
MNTSTLARRTRTREGFRAASSERRTELMAGSDREGPSRLTTCTAGGSRCLSTVDGVAQPRRHLGSRSGNRAGALTSRVSSASQSVVREKQGDTQGVGTALVRQPGIEDPRVRVDN